MSEQRRITEERAFQDFLALGQGRSLRVLHRSYIADTSFSAPSIHTLRSWCHKHGWMEKARDYDEAMRRETTAISTQDGAITAARLAGNFRSVATQSLNSALAALEDDAFAAATAKDLLALIDIAIRATDMAETLTRKPRET